MTKRNSQTERRTDDPAERKRIPGLILPFVLRALVADLSGSAFKLWMVLFLHSNRDGACFVGNDLLHRETGLSLGTLQRCKAELIASGWLERHGQTRGWKAGRYFVEIVFPSEVERIVGLVYGELKRWRMNIDEPDDRHFDWLVRQRVVTAMQRMGWTGGAMEPEAEQKAVDGLTASIRQSSEKGGGTRSGWAVWGTGLDDAGR